VAANGISTCALPVCFFFFFLYIEFIPPNCTPQQAYIKTKKYLTNTWRYKPIYSTVLSNI